MKYLRNTKILSLVLLIALLFSIFAVGCTPARKPMAGNNVKTSKTDVGMTANRAGMTGTNAGMIGTGSTELRYDEVRDKRIADQLLKINGVRSATVLTSGGITYIGLHLNKNFDASKTNSIRDEAIAITKKVNNSTYKVYVSTDPAVIAQIKRHIQDVKAGRPLSGLTP